MDTDEKYAAILLDALRVSADYLPKFGLGRRRGVSLDEFNAVYGADPLYSWIGFDAPAIYAAHRAAGGMTSLYRQLGIGCERLFRTLIQDAFGLTESQSTWAYSVPSTEGRRRVLKLDGRIDLGHLPESRAKRRLNAWIDGFKEKLDVESEIRGVVFEVRQGYKSKDSKRQNADLANAAAAYTQRYLPVLAVMSMQIDSDLSTRYEMGKWGVLSGATDSDDPHYSTYAFFNQAVGYDLQGFFQRNSADIRREVGDILKTLLEPT